MRVEGRVGRDIVELEERVVEGRVTDETEGREEKETEEVRMAEVDNREFRILGDTVEETAGGGVRLISGDREGRVTVEVLGGKTELEEVTEDIREGKKTEFEEEQVTVDV